MSEKKPCTTRTVEEVTAAFDVLVDNAVGTQRDMEWSVHTIFRGPGGDPTGKVGVLVVQGPAVALIQTMVARLAHHLESTQIH